MLQGPERRAAFGRLERFVTKFPATRYLTPCSGKGPPGSHGQAQLLRSTFLRAVERDEPIDLLGRVKP